MVSPRRAQEAAALRRQPDPLYGRDVELDLLRGYVDDALVGHGQLVLVSGEAGVGKTSLVEAAVYEAHRRGAVVISGQCYDLTTTPPYGAWIEALRGYVPGEGLPELPATLADVGLLDSLAGQDALFTELHGFFDEVARARPLVLLLEDQQWADSDGLEYLRRLARSIARRRVLLIVTYRDGDLSDDAPFASYLPLLARECQPQRVELRPLAPFDIHQMVADRYGLGKDDCQRLVDYLHYYAGGNPFFTGELLQSLEHDRLLDHDERGWVLADLRQAQVPILVRQVILSRVARLDETAQLLLQVAAVIGMDAPLTLWRAAVDIDAATFDGAVERIVAARLMHEDRGGTSLRFPHALVREALYTTLVLPRRRAWHQRIAELLAAQAGAEPVTVAHHFLVAGDAQAAHWLIQAGDGATRANAVQDAVEHYEHALELLEQQGDAAADRAHLLCHLAEAHRYTDPRRALEYLTRAQDIVDALGDRALAAVVLWSRARIRGFLGETTGDDVRAATAAWEHLDDRARERVFSLGRGAAGNAGPLAQWLAHHGRYAEAIDIGEACLAAQQGGGAPLHRNEIGHACFALGLAHAGQGRFAEATAVFERAVQHFRGVRNHFMAAATLKWQIIEVALPGFADDPALWQRLLAEYERERQLSRGAFAIDDEHPPPPVFQPLVVAGRWDEAIHAANSHLSARFLRVDALAALGEIARLRGRRAEAWERINQAIPIGPDASVVSPFFVRLLDLHRLAAELSLDEQRADDALRWIEAYVRLLESSGRALGRVAGLLLRARYERVRGNSEQAHTLAQEALDAARAPLQPVALIAAHRALGELSLTRQQLDEADYHLDRALVLSGACSAPYERALTLAARAEMYSAARRPDDARAAVDEAVAICEGLGATPLLERLAGVRERLAGGERAAAPFGTLSPRELDVLRLVARGMTDAEVAEQLYISPRTVAHHLRSIYSKLGISSRTAAAAYAYENDLV